MAVPQFVSGANVLKFEQGIQLPSNKPLSKVQAVDRTAGGTLQVEDFGVTFQRFNLDFSYLLSTTYSSLITWWDETADGSKNSFTYINELNESYTVRILNQTISFDEVRNGYFSGQLQLEVV